MRIFTLFFIGIIIVSFSIFENACAQQSSARPEKAPPEIASAKPNVPVKKESFSEKVNRIKADGNKVGVLFSNLRVYIQGPVDASAAQGSGGNIPGGLSGGVLNDKEDISKFPKDTVEAIAELNAMATSFIDEMNTAFDTDVFELVNINKIPQMEVMGAYLTDDWWSTKYKLLIIYNIIPYYELSNKGTDAYSGFFRVNSNLSAMELFMKKGKPRQKTEVGNANMGNFYKQLTVAPKEKIQSIADIEAHMDGKVTGKEVYEALNKDRADKLEKFIEKQKK